jgi:hypothetical protein
LAQVARVAAAGAARRDMVRGIEADPVTPED